MPQKRTRQNSEDADFELIRAINEGRPELFGELVRRYEGRLYNFGLKMCGNVQDAEDMVQDTFLNVFRYLKGFRYETRFRNWLYRIAASACIKKRRKSKFAPRREISLEDIHPAEGDKPPAELPSWASQPLDEVLNQELSRTLREAILALPENYRVVMLLRDIEGFSTAETARILGLTPANIKTRLHRARHYLRQQLQRYFDHDAQT